MLVVEALNNEFIGRFWEFINEGKYQEQQIGEGERQYYRFIKPKKENFPMQMELFSRIPDVIERTEEMVLTPIPVDEELSSLSAIIMDDEYYEFTIKHSKKGTTIHRADDLALICLNPDYALEIRSEC